MNEPDDKSVSISQGELNGGMEKLSVQDSAIGIEEYARNMQERCISLLEEVGQFQEYLKKNKQENSVELRHFKTGIQSELKSMEKRAAACIKLASIDPEDKKILQRFRDSNFPFYDGVWSAAKGCTRVITLGKRFYWNPEEQDKSAPIGKKPKPPPSNRKYSAIVDIVAHEGLEWVKVSTISEKRIIYDLAKAGLGVYSSDESEDNDGNQLDDEPDGLLKVAKGLIRASRTERVRYRHPRIRLMLTRIKSDCSKQVADIIEQIRKLGISVQTAEEIPEPAPLHEAFNSMTPDSFRTFSDIINVDLTILLALISDISHGQVQRADWHNKFVSQQREVEAEIQLVPQSLWPACGSKRLQCSSTAVERMKEIVETMGTETENERMLLMMNLEPHVNLSKVQRIEAFQHLSEYQVPTDWCLPIEVLDVDIPSTLAALPPVAEEISKALSSINQSVFLYGWATGRTTISSNRVVAKEIETLIEQHRSSDEDSGPDIWLCRTARSLVGKEKQKRGAGQHIDD